MVGVVGDGQGDEARQWGGAEARRRRGGVAVRSDNASLAKQERGVVFVGGLDQVPLLGDQKGARPSHGGLVGAADVAQVAREMRALDERREDEVEVGHLAVEDQLLEGAEAQDAGDVPRGQDEGLGVAGAARAQGDARKQQVGERGGRGAQLDGPVAGRGGATGDASPDARALGLRGLLLRRLHAVPRLDMGNGAVQAFRDAHGGEGHDELVTLLFRSVDGFRNEDGLCPLKLRHRDEGAVVEQAQGGHFQSLELKERDAREDGHVGRPDGVVLELLDREDEAGGDHAVDVGGRELQGRAVCQQPVHVDEDGDEDAGGCARAGEQRREPDVERREVGARVSIERGGRLVQRGREGGAVVRRAQGLRQEWGRKQAGQSRDAEVVRHDGLQAAAEDGGVAHAGRQDREQDEGDGAQVVRQAQRGGGGRRRDEERGDCLVRGEHHCELWWWWWWWRRWWCCGGGGCGGRAKVERAEAERLSQAREAGAEGLGEGEGEKEEGEEEEEGEAAKRVRGRAGGFAKRRCVQA